MTGHVSRRGFLIGTGAAAAAGMVGAMPHGAAQMPEAGKRRNIVLILTDDQRFDALGFAGHPFLETPHLDALARNGVVFENAFVTTALCSPSRATILTGLYAHQHGIIDNGTKLPGSIPTFPGELQKAGYETAFIGKWHMGGDTDEPRPGFDRWVSFRGQGVYTDPVFNIDGRRVQQTGYVTDLLTDQAEEFLRKPRRRPFFLYLSHKAVHAEFQPAPRHKGSYAAKNYPHPASMADTPEHYEGKPNWVRAQRTSWHGVDGMFGHSIGFDSFARSYAETLRAVDDSVGRVTALLRERGLLDSTLILFASDNGFLFGEHGLVDKRCMYEPSIRVPLIAHCPEIAPAGRRTEMTLNLDFAPSILDAAGCPIPESMRGRSFLPLIRGEKAEWRDAFLYEYFWERSFPQTPTVLGVRTERHKFMRFHGIYDRYELYDLEQDPNEMHNLLGAFVQASEPGPVEGLIRSKAEPELKALFKRMDEHLDRLIKETHCGPKPSWQLEPSR